MKAKGVEPRGLGQDLADGGAVAEDDDAPAGVGGGDALDGASQATPEDLAGLGAGDHVPALLGHHLREDGVIVGRLHAQNAALPLTEEHLAQVGLDDRGHAAAGHQRRRRLGRALQGA